MVLSLISGHITPPMHRMLRLLALVLGFASVLPLAAQIYLPDDFTSLPTTGLVFDQPVGVTWDENGREFVWEKAGKVWIIENGVRLSQPLVDISEEVGNWRDHGMLGFALDPGFTTNGRFYLLYAVDRHHLMNFGTASYVPTTNEYYAASIIRLTRYTALGPSHEVADPSSRSVLLGATPQTGSPLLHESHGAGSLVFGTDGTLMVTIGDNASYFGYDLGSAWETYYFTALVDGILRPNENVGAMRAQMVESLSGKLLRLDPNTGHGVSSNPWFDPTAPDATRSKVWALGLRNPYRMTLKPGSGSTDPAAGRPGVFYIGDVGLDVWEEQNVCTDPGMNFGWPLFEGLTRHTQYSASLIENMDEPNPGFNGTTCLQEHFYFQDLLKQDTRSLLNNHPMPCNAGAQIPPSVPTFLHARPSIDYLHGFVSRVGSFLGDSAVTFDLDDPNSPVPGPRFGGNAALGGPFMTGTRFPVEYQNSAFHGDYGQGWIRRFTYDDNQQVTSVNNFAYGLGPLSWLGEGPDGCIWYIKYDSGEVLRICYTGDLDLPPTAIATQTLQYGPGPLSVSFVGSASTDPEGQMLTYAWDFGIGTSDLADPTFIFPSPDGVVTTYPVTLTVTDPAGQSSTASLIVSVNNSPPVVDISSIDDGALFPIGIDTVFQLEALVTDAEHGPAQLTYGWRTTLFHNTHNHPEPLDANVVSSTVISGVGCGTESFHYTVELTVTDEGGLSGTSIRSLFPNCAAIAPVAILRASGFVGPAPYIVAFDASDSYDPGTIVSYLWDFGDGTTSTSITPSRSFTTPGEYLVRLVVTDDDGLTDVETVMITVLSFAPPQCVGPIGGIERQVWNGVNGSSVLDLLNSPTYPDSPSATSVMNSMAAPSGVGNNYGQRIRGYIIPPESGNYFFTATADDNAAVYLSLNADPQFKRLICSVPGPTTPNGFFTHPEQVSSSVELQAGVYYYVEVLHKEGSGGDHCSLWWQTPSSGQRVVIPGASLAPWQDCGPHLEVKMALQGPWDSSANSMRDDLRINGLIPVLEPYSGLGFTLVASGGEIADVAQFAANGNNAIVDWVLVELRDRNQPTSVLATKSALLQRDGDVVDVQGHRRLLFDVPPDEYFVAVRHRNHLGVMTAGTVMLSGANVSVDFTDPATLVHGQIAQATVGNGLQALWSGNVNRDGMVKYTGTLNDRDPILVSIGGSTATNVVYGYLSSDVNMDGSVKYTGQGNDRDPILVNIGGSVPTAIRQGQLP